ncbi:MAG TPA: substrate-binding domain-containing protein [Solirubrobacteraceae bacterium]|nr:substrate-binding domain-containing protein [Solirubrobacteraceae bacterium]
MISPGRGAGTRALLGSASRPTAIFYATDLMGISGRGVAGELGIEIPGKLSMVGFDDIPLARHLYQPLTTIRQDPVAAGAAAAELLLAWLRDEQPRVPRFRQPHSSGASSMPDRI